MKLINSIFVVEGKNDYEKVLKCGVPYAVITKGYNVSRETVNHLLALEKTHNIVILTDPDGPGRKTAERIKEKIISSHIISVPKSLATGKKEVGIERIPLQELKEIIAPYTGKEFISRSNVTYLDLISLELSGPNSKARKEAIAQRFSLLTGPLKIMHKQILLLNISREDLKDSLNEERSN